MLEANRPALTRDEVSAMIVPAQAAGCGQSALNDLLSELAGELEPEAETALRAALSAADEQDRISEILDTLLYANDAAFDATADDLVVELDSLPRQSDLAHALLGASLAGDLAAFVQSSDFRSADPIFRRAYKRLGKLIPWIADQDRLDILYGTSNENALRVAGIDLLNLYYSMSLADLMGGSPQASSPPRGRRAGLPVSGPSAQPMAALRAGCREPAGVAVAAEDGRTYRRAAVASVVGHGPCGDERRVVSNRRNDDSRRSGPQTLICLRSPSRSTCSTRRSRGAAKRPTRWHTARATEPCGCWPR